MIDIHCHILPGVDDGADRLETSCEMAQIAADSGVDTIIATPHCNLPDGMPNYKSIELESMFSALDRIFQHYEIPIRLLPGAEVLVRDNLQELLDEDRLISLNHSRYLLVEFYFNATASFISQSLAQIMDSGFVPVVAHPERYDAVQLDPLLAVHWFHEGYILQINKGSLLGRLGRNAHRASMWLLDHGLGHTIASDAHSNAVRTTDMDQIKSLLYDRYPEAYVELLLKENPRRIIQDKPIPIPSQDY